MSGATQMDAVIAGKGLPVPINTDPFGINRGDKAVADASAAAITKRGRLPEPVGVVTTDPSGATPASNNGAAAADEASAMPARVPIPPVKPILLPHKPGKPLPTAPVVPPVASSGDVY